MSIKRKMQMAKQGLEAAIEHLKGTVSSEELNSLQLVVYLLDDIEVEWKEDSAKWNLKAFCEILIKGFASPEIVGMVMKYLVGQDVDD